jgi:hypothetical protein
MYTPVVSELDSARADEADLAISSIIPFADADDLGNEHRYRPFVYGALAVDVTYYSVS